MHGGYTHILLAENTVKSQLRDTAVTQDPLSVLAFGRIYDDEINATPGANRPNGRKDYQLLYVKQGTLQITIDNKQQNLTQNTLILLRPGEPQLYKGLYKGKQVVDRLFVHFSGYHAAKLLEQYNITESIMQFSEPLDAFEDIINRMMISQRQRYKQRICDLLLEELFILISNALDNTIIHSKARSCDALVEMMKNNCTKNLPIKAYADYLGFNENYFLRFFKKAMGVSPYKYILRLRMDQACKLLIYSEDSIKSIALRLGYNNSHHFSNVFRSFYGLTPSEYRNNNSPHSISRTK